MKEILDSKKAPDDVFEESLSISLELSLFIYSFIIYSLFIYYSLNQPISVSQESIQQKSADHIIPCTRVNI